LLILIAISLSLEGEVKQNYSPLCKEGLGEIKIICDD